MEKLVVHGGFTLRGAVNISGSKNASLPILAASLLTDEPVVVRRVPDVSDTNFMVQIMGQLGASVERSSGNVRVEARNLHSEAAYEQVRKMRASICLMGPLMARMQRCVIPLPGGCVIGDRPVDLHIRAIQALGAQVQIGVERSHGGFERRPRPHRSGNGQPDDGRRIGGRHHRY